MIAPPRDVVAVVDDDARVCRAVSRTLAMAGYGTRQFTSARDYIAARDRLAHDCLLADIRMPGLDGIQMHRLARLEGSRVPTVFMTATSDVGTIVAAFRSGAVDVLPKPFSAEALTRAVERAIARARDERTREAAQAELWGLAATLTRREAEVATLVVSGRLNKQVAQWLGIGEKTVKVHRGRAMQKLRAHSLAELVRIVDHLTSDEGRTAGARDGSASDRPAIVRFMRDVAERAARAGETPQADSPARYDQGDMAGAVRA